MIDLKKIEDKITLLSIQLWEKKEEYRKAKESNLKEQYGDNFGCDNCAYGCCVEVLGHCTNCVKNRCIYCNHSCDDYMPENELSRYIKKYHYYNENIIDKLNDLFEVSDIMKFPELHQKALDILKPKDKKEIK